MLRPIRASNHCHTRGVWMATSLGLSLGLAVLQASPARAKTLQAAPPPPISETVAPRSPADPDTTWFGGRDSSGVAMLGGVWDFEDGTLQGWTSTDLTDVGSYFRHITPDSVLHHPGQYGDDSDPSMGWGSMWCGLFEDESSGDCWPGYQGYGNYWRQTLERTFPATSGTVGFDYFVDSEAGFDFVYIYARDENGERYGPFNSHPTGNSDGFGYSGSVQEGVNHGGSEAVFVSVPGGSEMTVEFMVSTDPIVSDALDFFGYFLDTDHGPFGVDNIHFNSGPVSDFEAEEGYAVEVHLDRAYLAEGHAFRVIDISDPLAPVVLGEAKVPDAAGAEHGVARGVAFVSDVALVTGGAEGLLVYDVANPATPALVNVLPSISTQNAWAIDVEGDIAYVIDDGRLEILDVSAPTSPISIDRPPFGLAYTSVVAGGNYVYLADSINRTLVVVDVSDPTRAFVVANSTSLGTNDTREMELVGDYLYVAQSNPARLGILDVSVPTLPVFVGSAGLSGSAKGVDLSNHLAYVSTGWGIVVVDVTDPGSPHVVGSRQTPGTANWVVVRGRHAYVSDGIGGLQLANIANPTTPILAARVPVDILDGWIPSRDTPVGTLMHVENLATLHPAPDAACRLSGNVLVSALTGTTTPAHPRYHNEIMVSNSIPISGPGSYQDVIVQADVFSNVPLEDAGVGFRTTVHYYPWTCPSGDPWSGWTVEPAGEGWFQSDLISSGSCDMSVHMENFLPTWVESLRVTIQVLGDCSYFGDSEGCDALNSNHTPYFDNIRLGLVEYNNIFADVTVPPLDESSAGQGVAWGDYDGDGDEDLFLANSDTSNRLYRLDGGTFADVSNLLPTLTGYAGAWVDYDADGDVDLYISRQGANVLLRNDGGVFVDVTPTPLDDDQGGRGVGWADYDLDGDLDVYLGNEPPGAVSYLVRNEGTYWDETYTPIVLQGSATAVAWGDYDDDGDPDLFTSNTQPGQEAATIFRNDGGANFFPILITTDRVRGAAWGDYDNDQDLDLVLGGSPRIEVFRNDGADVFVSVWSHGASAYGVEWTDFDLDGDLDLFTAGASTNRLFANHGNDTFADFSFGDILDGFQSRGQAWSDYDADGDLDVYVASDGYPNRLLRNDQNLFIPRTSGRGMANNWLRVRPIPVNDATSIGARVRVVAGGTTQTREITCGSGYLSQSTPTAFFGLGPETTIDLIEVTWPTGETQTVTNVPVNQEIPIRSGWTDVAEGDLADSGSGRSAAWGDYDDDGDPDLYVVMSTVPDPNRLYRNDAGTLVDITSPPLDHDALGHGAVWVDLDDDTDLDLYLLNEGPNRVFRNDGGSFVDATTPPFESPGISRSAAAADYDLDGDLDLYVANANSANLLLRNDAGVFVDATSEPLGDGELGRAVAWGDYDDDGDPDLYLGKGSQPNRLFRNEGDGTFVDATTPLLDDAGNAVSVEWLDYDNDADLDLYLLNFTGFDRLFRNDGPSGFVSIPGPQAALGRGMSAAWADFDLDGDLDVHVARRNEPDRLYLNQGDDTFVDGTVPPLDDPGRGQSTAWADLDDDGDLDLFVANSQTPDRLLRNELETGAHWLQVDLVGTASNSRGVGARIEVTTGGVTQVRSVRVGNGTNSQSSLTAAFGLGSAVSIDEVRVIWPSGTIQTASAGVNQRIVLTEPLPSIDVNPLTLAAEIPVGSLTALALTVENAVGAAPLNWTVTEDGDCEFVSMNPSAGTTPSGGSTTVVVSIDVGAVATGAYECNLTIASNDPEQAEVQVPLAVVVRQTVLSVPEERLFTTQSSPAGTELVEIMTDGTERVIGSSGLIVNLDGLAIRPNGAVYATTHENDHIYRLDGASGASFDLGSLGTADPLWGLTFDAAGDLWGLATTSGTFYSVDPDEVTATPVGTPGTVLGTGMGFDAVEDRVLIVVSVDGFSAIVWDIDRTTGVPTFLTSVNHGLTDIAIDLDGAAYGVDDTRLYEVDLGSGIVTQLSTLGPTFGLAAWPSGIVFAGSVGVPLPTVAQVRAAHPNPFRAYTRIGFSLPVDGRARIDVFDASGRRVRSLLDERRSAGTHDVVFDGSRLASGIYFYRVMLPGLDQTRRMVLVK